MFLWFQEIISCRIKPNKFFFLAFLVEFQLYFTGYLKVYVTVLLLKKYLTSKISWTSWSWKVNFYNLKMPLRLKYIWLNFWKFHDDLKTYLEVVRLPSWPENVKFSVKMQWVPWKYSRSHFVVKFCRKNP